MAPERFRELLEQWRERLGLGAWWIELRVEVEEDEEEDGTPTLNLMSVERHESYRYTVLRVHPAVVGEGTLPPSVDRVFLEGEDAEQFLEGKLVHELLHLTLRDLVEVAYSGTESRMGADAYREWAAAWKRVEEETVEGLAVALVAARRAQAPALWTPGT